MSKQGVASEEQSLSPRPLGSSWNLDLRWTRSPVGVALSCGPPQSFLDLQFLPQKCSCPPWTAFLLNWQGRQQVLDPVRQEEDRMGSFLFGYRLGEFLRPLILFV